MLMEERERERATRALIVAVLEMILNVQDCGEGVSLVEGRGREGKGKGKGGWENTCSFLN